MSRTIRFQICLSFAMFVASTATADEKPAIQTEYYLGESKMTTPTGQLIRTSLSLVKRILNKTENRIEEHVMTIDEKGPPRSFVVTMDVRGAKCTLSEKSKSFEGEGELFGDAWAWKGWKTATRMAGGMGTVVSEDKLTDRGITAKKTYAGADGKVQLHFEETLDRISAKTYEILAAKLTPGEKK